MTKCLITKLKAVVDNPNLPILGEIKIPFVVTSTNSVGINSGTHNIFTVSGIVELELTDLSNEAITFDNGLKTITLNGLNNPHTNIRNSKVGDTGIIKIKNKYKINSVNFCNTGNEGSLNVSRDFVPDLSYLTDLHHIRLNGIDNYIWPKDITKLETVIMYSSKGKAIDIDQLVPKNVITLSLTSSSCVTGDVAWFKDSSMNKISDFDAGQVINQTSMHGDLADLPNKWFYCNYPLWGNDTTLVANGYTGFTWTKGKRTGSSCNMLLFGSIDKSVSYTKAYFASKQDVDNYFIDNATCSFVSGNHFSTYLYVDGTYIPSAEAQAAIKAMYSAGVQIIRVNNIELDAYK